MKTWLKWALGGAAVLGVASMMRGDVRKPSTKQAMEATYGALREGIDWHDGEDGRIVVSPQWQAEHLVQVRLQPGNHLVTVNKKIADEVVELWARAAYAAGWWPDVVQSWVARHINWDVLRNLSLHSYGIALDLDPKHNPRGATPGELAGHPDWLQVWLDAGWTWGGNWSGSDRDAMHLQAAGVA